MPLSATRGMLSNQLKDLESMVDRLDNCNGKDKKQIEKKKRTIRKRKQNRMKNYTDSGLFEITL